MDKQKVYKHIVVVYRYEGGNDYSCDYHEDEDWVQYPDVDIKHALYYFWNKSYDDGSCYVYRKEHRKDFRIKNVFTFETYDDFMQYRHNWWNEGRPLKEVFA